MRRGTSRTVDPLVAKVLADAIEADPRPIERLSLAEARARGGSVRLPPMRSEAVLSVRDLVTDGDPPIALRLYRPRSGRLPVLIYFHGGGWVTGSVALADPFCRSIANGSGCAVLSVEYRLAPESPYPAAADDAYSATQWCHRHAPALDLDAEHIAVGGFSAGGNLAAVVAQRARDRGGPPIVFQMLQSPVTDHDFDRPSYREFGLGCGLTAGAMRWYWDQYVPRVQQRDEPYASPVRAETFRDLPAALVVTAECDPLRDEGRAYADRLRAAGVSTNYLEHRGMIHFFMQMASTVPAAQRALREMAQELRRAIS